MASVPVVVCAIDGDGGDAVVPVLVRVAGKRQAGEVVRAARDADVDSAEIGVVEDAHLGSVEQTDGTDLVVESGRHGGPTISQLQAKIISREIAISVEACPGFRGSGKGTALLPLPPLRTGRDSFPSSGSSRV